MRLGKSLRFEKEGKPSRASVQRPERPAWKGTGGRSSWDLVNSRRNTSLHQVFNKKFMEATEEDNRANTYKYRSLHFLVVTRMADFNFVEMSESETFLGRFPCFIDRILESQRSKRRTIETASSCRPELHFLFGTTKHGSELDDCVSKHKLGCFSNIYQNFCLLRLLKIITAPSKLLQSLTLLR
jgi:hypothetical protein